MEGPGRRIAVASEAMHSRDRVAKAFGMTLVSSVPGRAELHMTVREDMLNGHAVCHGGVIFTLADTALAHATNNRDLVAFATECIVDFVSPASLGDVLVAVAEERSLRGRTCICDATVTTAAGALIALFRGKTRSVGRPVVDPDGVDKK